jgi:hypothetical protein
LSYGNQKKFKDRFDLLVIVDDRPCLPVVGVLRACHDAYQPQQRREAHSAIVVEHYGRPIVSINIGASGSCGL